MANTITTNALNANSDATKISTTGTKTGPITTNSVHTGNSAATSTSRAIIGSIPGYNTNIDPNGYYAKKLLSNINRVVLTPTGYSLNLSGAIPLLTGLERSNDLTSGKLFAIGSNVNTSTGFGISGEKTIGTETALGIWKSILESSKSVSNIDPKYNIDPNIQGLEILCTNDSTFTEVFSNNYKPSWLDSNGQIQNFIGKFDTLKTINSMMSSFDADAGRAIMRASNSGNDILNILSGKALGFQTTLPKEWANSDYISGLQIMIRLVSPSGHWKDISQYIIKPMMYLINAASPVTYNGISYGHPMLWQIRAEGMQNIDIGAISTMTISRGGTDTIFNQYNQPLNIDIRISLESIINGFAIGIGPNFYVNDSYANKASLITSPKDIMDSFTYLSSNSTPKEISVKL